MPNSYEDALGEYQAFGDARIVLPASMYPVKLAIRDVKTTDVQNEGTEEEYGGVPYVDLVGDIYDGPFTGESIEARLKMQPGKSGGLLGFLKGATKTITRQPAVSEVLAKFFDFSHLGQGDPKDKGYRTAVREALRDQFWQLDPAQRLEFMLKYLRIQQWDQKSVIAQVGTREYDSNNINPATGAPYVNTVNTWQGFYDVTDPAKGLAFVKAVEFPKQEALAMEMGVGK